MSKDFHELLAFAKQYTLAYRRFELVRPVGRGAHGLKAKL
jgi:hypothetical protein